ncbi:hypothetical protein [uncultured Olegusella sp.]|uniref:hypothetical protein n=1 Tax=uncultured Olegusella sp. TaxID=1979846 RepID=UPI002604DDA6|nr:hypothetical protein [uncultured Olegusella sp.]
MDIMSTDEFEPRTVDKVERLLDLLGEMERHPALKGKLALHGGTAINLFMLDVSSARDTVLDALQQA